MEHFHRLAHSVWDCKYHIVWIPKYRRKELYGDKRRIVVDTIKQWARIKGIEIIEGHAMPDHIHLCVSIPPKYSVAHTIGLLKGKSASEVMSFGTKSSWYETPLLGGLVIPPVHWWYSFRTMSSSKDLA